MDVDLIVLAGGRGARLGGYDKATLVVGGRTLLQRALDADLGGRVVVVGPTEVPEGIPRTVEDPPGGGPVAGIGAGLDALQALAAAGVDVSLERPDTPGPSAAPADWVAVAAVDQPNAAAVLTDLAGHLDSTPDDVDALCHRDPDGRRQWLLAIYRRRALEAARARLDREDGASVGSLVAGLRWRQLEARGAELGDIDTWEDLARWEGSTRLTVRPATVRDVTAIATVRVQGWRVAFAGLVPREALDRLDVTREAARRRAVWEERHQDPRVLELVAEVAGPVGNVADADAAGETGSATRVVGWALAGPASDEDRLGQGELVAMYALPGYWGAGVGHRLLMRVEDHLRAHGFDRAYLWALEGNDRAAAFYERHGWLEDGVTMLDQREGYALTLRRRVRVLS